MAEGIDKAAAAFEAVINGDPNTVAKKTGGKGVDNSGPPEVLFGNVGELDPDTDARGGGDDEDEVDENKTEKDKTDPRGPRKRDKEADDDGEESDDDGDGDESDGDAGDEGDPESDDGLPDDDEETSKEDAEFLKREVELTVDGEPVTVSLQEALQGYVRTETFHRRMNQLDEAKKIVRRAAADAVQN
jgi:hypothetical protein